MPDTPKSSRLIVALPPEVRRELERIAAAWGCSLTQAVRLLILGVKPPPK